MVFQNQKTQLKTPEYIINRLIKQSKFRNINTSKNFYSTMPKTI